jgi:hypothetical protein
MYQQRLSHLIHTGPLNVAVIIIVVIGLTIGGLIGLQAARVPLSDTNPAIRLAPLTRVQVADSARLNAIAGEQYNLYDSTTWIRAPKLLTRAQSAEANRYTAIAGEQFNLYGNTPGPGPPSHSPACRWPTPPA